MFSELLKKIIRTTKRTFGGKQKHKQKQSKTKTMTRKQRSKTKGG